MSAGPGEPPVFVNKLLAMVEDKTNSALIDWAPRGETFIVTDADRLAEVELPKYFKHSNFTSLVRQLNMYGFHKVTSAGGVKTVAREEPQIWEFIHPCVQRGRPELLVHVRRKENASTKKRMAKEETSGVMNEMMNLRDQHMRLKMKFDMVQKQNEALWKEIAEHRHRHAQQTWKIERIMKYINALYVNGEAGAVFNQEAKKSRTMSAPPRTMDGDDDAMVAEADITVAPTSRQNAGTPTFTYPSLEESGHVVKQLLMPHQSHEHALVPSEAHELKSALENHLGEYDAHLGRHEAQLERHLDDHFMASIFNPPNGADLLVADADPFKSDFSALENAVQVDIQRGAKRGAEEMTTDEDLMSAMEIFTPLHEFINDAVVPE
eukprot:m.93000 g.93000  ORF g.93000 m.93000 type:complete len:379 (+) comp20263_c0_seq1:51-1187(+)